MFCEIEHAKGSEGMDLWHKNIPVDGWMVVKEFCELAMGMPGNWINPFYISSERTVIFRESIKRSTSPHLHSPVSTGNSAIYLFKFHFQFQLNLQHCACWFSVMPTWNGFYSRFYIPLLFIPIVDITLYASFFSRRCIMNEWGNIQHDVFIELVDICSLSLYALNNTREE